MNKEQRQALDTPVLEPAEVMASQRWKLILHDDQWYGYRLFFHIGDA